MFSLLPTANSDWLFWWRNWLLQFNYRLPSFTSYALSFLMTQKVSPGKWELYASLALKMN